MFRAQPKNVKQITREIIDALLRSPVIRQGTMKKHSSHTKGLDCLQSIMNNLFGAYIGFGNYVSLSQSARLGIKEKIVDGAATLLQPYLRIDHRPPILDKYRHSFTAMELKSKGLNIELVYFDFPESFHKHPMKLYKLLEPVYASAGKEFMAKPGNAISQCKN